jgi:glucose/arabinose dehydrogenase/plastocyanin
LRWLTVTFVALVLLVAGGMGRASAEPVGFKVQLFLDGRSNDVRRPVDLAWVPGTKRMFLSLEDAGEIRIINNGRLLSQPCATLDVGTRFDHGLTGLVLHPDFAENKHLYAYYTDASDDALENKVVRFTVHDGVCENETEIVGDLGVGNVHQGGQMVFDNAGYLFVTTGENQNPALAQDLTSRMGKVLRVNPDGSIPEDNPFPADENEPRNAIWSYGHRNGFGLAYIADDDDLIETENGPFCDDELNLIEGGKNYGWGPDYRCHDDPGGYNPIGDNLEEPLHYWSDTIAPTDAWWYEGPLGVLSDALYVGDFNNSQLHRFVSPVDAPVDDVVYSLQNRPSTPGHPPHRIISVSKGPGRWLYVVARDDIYRLVPGDSEEVGVVNDDFTPATANVGVGGFVRWTRVDPDSDRDHDIVQTRGLFYSPETNGPIDFTATFSAGKFPYQCSFHFGMDGIVKVPPLIEDGPAGKPFLVRWATATTDTGNDFDIDYRVNDRPWQRWKRGVEALSAVFGRHGNPVTLDAGKEYSFRVRSRNGSDKSEWSPVSSQTL